MRIDAFKEYVTVIGCYEFEVRYTAYGKKVAIWRDYDRWPRTVFEVWKLPVINALYDLTDNREKPIKIKVRGKEHLKKGQTVDGQPYERTVVTVDSWRLL